MFRSVILLLISLLLVSANSEAFGQIQWEPFPLPLSDEHHDRVNFGYLTVPENYDDPDGRKIEIAFAIVKAEISASEPDAVIYFEGGWGAPTLQNLSRLIEVLDFENRDVIYFDSRGVGFSKPGMCKELGKAIFEDLSSDIDHEALHQIQLRRFNDCLDKLEEQGIDYNQYGHNNSSRDALTLAENLEYSAYNLLGISNGTRHIQNFLRAAESTDVSIRSATLDSTVPMGIAKQGLVTSVYARTLNMLFDACEQSAPCSKKFPNLRTRFLSFIKSLDEQPLTVPLQGQNGAFTINKTEMNAIIHQLLYQHQFYDVFPIFINDLIEGNTNLLELMIPLLENRLVTIYGSFVGFVQYAYNDKVFNRESIEIYDKSIAEMPDLEVWEGYFIFLREENRLDTDSLEAIPVESDVPALITAGNYDPITPPEWSQLLVNRFANAYYFEFPALGHGVIPTPCGLILLDHFLDNPKIKPNPACLDEKLGEEVEFITEYYENPRIGNIALTVLGKPNIVLGVSVFLIIVICLINLIRSALFLFKPDKPFPGWLFICSLLILTLLTGLALSFFSTLNQNFFLIASGLVRSANTWLYLSPVLFLSISAYLFTMIKSEARSKWSYVALAGFILFAAILVLYRLFPDF